MKTIVLLIILTTGPWGLGGDVEVWKDMDSCHKRIDVMEKRYNSNTHFACVPVTKEELENPRSGKGI